MVHWCICKSPQAHSMHKLNLLTHHFIRSWVTTVSTCTLVEYSYTQNFPIFFMVRATFLRNNINNTCDWEAHGRLHNFLSNPPAATAGSPRKRSSQIVQPRLCEHPVGQQSTSPGPAAPAAEASGFPARRHLARDPQLSPHLACCNAAARDSSKNLLP